MSMPSDPISVELERIYGEVQKLNQQANEIWATRPPEVVKDYALKANDGSDVTLSSLFGDHDKLIVIHNMGFSCPYCTLWADGFSGTDYFIKQKAAFVLTSPDSPEKQKAGKAERGWSFDLYSTQGSSFAEDMGFKSEKYLMPGASTFIKHDDGSITRYAYTFFGPGDSYCGVFHFFNLFPAENPAQG